MVAFCVAFDDITISALIAFDLVHIEDPGLHLHSSCCSIGPDSHALCWLSAIALAPGIRRKVHTFISLRIWRLTMSVSQSPPLSGPPNLSALGNLCEKNCLRHWRSASHPFLPEPMEATQTLLHPFPLFHTLLTIS